jgi:hypothetical protein
MSATPFQPGPAVLPDFSPELPGHLHEFSEKKTVLLRKVAQSEKLSAVRPASMLEIRPQPEMVSTGIPDVDALSGGVPRGCLTEIWGGTSSGKTSVMLATIAVATGRGESCVLIDASDSFDPASGHAAGIDFRKLLWVRCGERSSASGSPRTQKSSERRLEQVLKATDLILQSGGFGLIVLDLAGITEKFARRIPLASWFRFQRAVEHTKSALLVVSQSPCAQTCAAMAIFIEQSTISIQQSAKPAHAELLEKIQSVAEVVRSRWQRKPMQCVRANFETRVLSVG